jgi:uncharacterized protein YndB with AHSA1/START domain
MSETRSITQELFIAAPPDAVWRALVDPSQLKSWFAPDARVKPGVGGEVWVSWGEGMEGGAPITVWEPDRWIEWAESHGPYRLAVDVHLEPAEGGTIVRLVHSGFGTGAEWDEQFHMTEGGWSYFMQNLRHVLERHPGVPRIMINAREKVALSQQEAFSVLTGTRGLAAVGSLHGLAEGDRFDITTSAGDALQGSVIVQRAPGHLGLRIDNLNDALLLLEVEPAGDGHVRPALWLSLYGVTDARVAEARAGIGRMYANAFAIDSTTPADAPSATS